MDRKRLLVIAMVVLLVVSAWVPVITMGNNQDPAADYVGPGKHETALCITSNGKDKSGKQEFPEAGMVAVWNTRDQFFVSVKPEAEWEIMEVRVFVGTGPVPVTQGGPPQLGLFPYREHFT